MTVRFDIYTRLQAALAIFLLGLLSGCSGATQPFSKSTTPSGRTPPAITVTALDGLPVKKASLLFSALVEEARKRDIPVVRGKFQGGFSLAGSFQAMAQPGGPVQVGFSWLLTDGRQKLIHRIGGTQTGRPGSAGPWSGVGADLLRIIADQTAESLSSRLAQLGYATRAAGLPPPGQLEWAGPGADNEIDYETVYGPGAVGPRPVMDLPAPQEKADNQAGTEPLPGPEKKVAAKTAGKADKADRRKGKSAGKSSKRAKKKISAVAMLAVTGSPGSGNRDLRNAMRTVMKDAGWPVLDAARDDALSVTCKVKLGRAQAGFQKVVLVWTVRLPGGKVLGTVRQANKVRAGSLDKGWGKTAIYASRAAARGIFSLVSKLR